jgi:hypothetical protein
MVTTIHRDVVRQLITGDAVGLTLQVQGVATAGDRQVLRRVGMLARDTYGGRAGVAGTGGERFLNRVVGAGAVAGLVADINLDAERRADGGGVGGDEQQRGGR